MLALFKRAEVSENWRRNSENVKQPGRHINSFVMVKMLLDIMDRQILQRHLKENTHVTLGDYMKNFSSKGRVSTRDFLEQRMMP